jgi:hypothetical protein
MQGLVLKDFIIGVPDQKVSFPICPIAIFFFAFRIFVMLIEIRP